MRRYRRQNQQAKEKAANREKLSLEAQLPMSELIAGVRDDIEAFAAELGLTIIQRVMEREIQQKLGLGQLSSLSKGWETPTSGGPTTDSPVLDSGL